MNAPRAPVWQLTATWLSPEHALQALANAYVGGGVDLGGDIDIVLRRGPDGIKMAVFRVEEKT
jgi:hypothetical protein